jgi:geranylgeranyl diphosphate synthase, type I
MKTPVILEKYRSAIDGEIKRVIDSRSSPLYSLMRYHFGWTDKKGNPASGNYGKALRPALCLFCCEAAGGDYRQALPAAAALELVHNFSLIHDDIQDNDRERRHRPSVWAIWGKAQAINAGTAMRILANTALQRLGENGVLPDKQAHLQALLDEISLKLIEGQYLDIEFEDRYDINTADYLAMIGGKTASLISGSMETGAYLGTNCEAAVSGLRQVGWDLGLAFQIRDDILGIWGNENETGKPSGNDIRRRKKSYPVVYTLEAAEGGMQKELVSIYKNRLMDENTVNRVLAIFESAGTRENAQKLVDRYCTSASRIFNSLKLSPAVEAEMDELVQFLTGREY